MVTSTTRRIGTLICALAISGSVCVAVGGSAFADPSDVPPPVLPEFVATPSDFVAQFPYPYDQTQKNVTDVDVNAEREMCQWFTARYRGLRDQMDAFGFNLLQANNDWTVGTIQAQADAVAANIENAINFLTPRTTALTISQDFAGDMYFPLYQGETFYRLWQELSNVNVGIRARNTAWVYGPPQQRVKRWASQIERSRICEQ